MPKGILFLSIMDFTDKGIQVIKLTPEYFAKNGWNVHYVVTRDNSKYRSYHYQDVINPEGVVVYRSDMPSCRLGERLNNHLLKTIYSKLTGYLAIIKLAWLGHRVLGNNKIDVIYGGGPHGVLAAKLVKFFHPWHRLATVSRFYGVWDLYSKTILGHKWFKLLLNVDVFAALYLRSNLTVITNDGTQGDKALSSIRLSNMASLRFYVNGIDEYSIDPADLIELRESLHIEKVFSAVCITRLVSTKRVDLCIKVTAAVVNKYGVCDFRLIVVGDGYERARLEKLAVDLRVANQIVFVGSVDNWCVKNYLAIADVFLSMYDVSNVGNPLLEAIRANKIIFTLNNGDTSAWIKHRENGFIYDVNDSMVDRMARDIVDLISNPSLRDRIKGNIRITEKEKLWTWNERMQAEFTDIDRLVSKRPLPPARSDRASRDAAIP
jgi:glycosyltransferase involved in cell wall biosynthesis